MAIFVKILFLIRISQLTGRLLRRIGLEVQEVQAVLLTKHYAAVDVALCQKALTAVRKLDVEQWLTALQAKKDSVVQAFVVDVLSNTRLFYTILENNFLHTK